jgi:hypothetical protein
VTTSTRREPLTFKGACDLADVIRQTPGWRVVEVLGERPQGPLPSRPARSSTKRKQRARLPATIHAVSPDGRQVNIGSWQRWTALLAR